MNNDIRKIFDDYIAENASQADREILFDWLSTDPELNKWLEKKLVSADTVMDESIKQRILDNLHRKIQPSKNKRFYWRIDYKVAAVILMVLSIGLTSLLVSKSSKPVQYFSIVAQKGQKSNVILPDGSKVLLNSESKLVYSTDYNDNDRVLKLEGEAYFEVAKNKHCPFIVEAATMKVEALGTKFNVKAYPNESVVSAILAEGSVKVSNEKDLRILYPNEEIYLDKKSHKFTVYKLDNARESIGWLENKLYFNNTPFADVISNLERIYNINISFKSKRLEKHRFSGMIPNNSIETVMRILSLSAPLRFESINGNLTIYEIESEEKYFSR